MDLFDLLLPKKLIKKNSGESPSLISESIFLDYVTDKAYKIYLKDGNLFMEETEKTNNEKELFFVDSNTNKIFRVYVENRQLKMTEVE